MTFLADAKTNFLEKLKRFLKFKFEKIRHYAYIYIKVLGGLKKGFVSRSELHVLKNGDQTSYSLKKFSRGI